MPMTDRTGESKPDSAWPGQELSCWLGGRDLGAGRRAGGRLGDPLGEAVPAADAVQAQQGQRQQPGDDHEELQHLVVDRGREPAEGDVGEHDRGRDEQRHPQRPAEQRLHDGAEQVEVDARDQQLREGEGDRVDQVGARPEPAEHELRDRAHLRAVVERHHHDAEEQHRRDRADPEVVDRRQPELGARGRHAHDLDRAEVGGDERQAGDPRRAATARRGRSRPSRRRGAGPAARCRGRRRSRSTRIP